MRSSLLHAPSFWWRQKPGPTALLLSPLARLYGGIAASRMAKAGEPCAIPVICIGNFVMGGAGKTPTALALGRLMLAEGENPFFLSRGYGGKRRRATLVDPAHHTSHDVGDEALLLSKLAPTIVGSNRRASARMAQKLGASLLILDDGLQNPRLNYDLSLAVIDAKAGIGNGLCFPAGPLRAPLDQQMTHVSAILIAVKTKSETPRVEALAAYGKPILSARLVASASTQILYAGKKVVAFAGIGLPEKFKATLEEIGADIIAFESFPDHHVYHTIDLKTLQTTAFKARATLLTTEKDLARIPPSQLDPAFPMPVALPVELVFDDETAIKELVMTALARRRGKA